MLSIPFSGFSDDHTQSSELFTYCLRTGLAQIYLIFCNKYSSLLITFGIFLPSQNSYLPFSPSKALKHMHTISALYATGNIVMNWYVSRNVCAYQIGNTNF